MKDEVITWLLDGDPAIRWQVHRDLLHSPARVVARERSRVAKEGWGARLLACQRPDGHWGAGAYFPKWTCTTYTLQLLRDLGMPPVAPVLRACRALLDEGVERDGGLNFFGPRRKLSETCITGMVLSQVCALGLSDARTEGVIDYLLREQLADGGWNCLRPQGATHSSFHTTVSVLEGLRAYLERGGRLGAKSRRAEARGQRFFFVHSLFRSSRTGELVSRELLRPRFPPYWHADVLRVLDGLRAAGAPRDSRCEEGVEFLRAGLRRTGRLKLPAAWPGAVHFTLERPGQPSRWNTLRALRVLAWWDGAAGSRGRARRIMKSYS